MLERLGRLVARHRLIVLGVWAVLLVAGGVLGGGVFDRTQSVDGAPAGSESAVAQARLDALDPEGETISAVITGRDFYDRALMDSATAAMFEIREIPGVHEVFDAYTRGGLIGDSGQSSLVVVELDLGLDEDELYAVADRVTDVLHRIDAPEVLVGGEMLTERAFVDRALTDTARGEAIALGVLVVLLVIVLGGVRVGGLPILTALATVAVALLGLTALVGLVPVNEFAVNVMTLLGLGLGVDYSLLLIFRFREERERDPDAAVDVLVGRAVTTAGRAVLVSGAAVGIALVGLLLLGDPLLSGMAVGGAVVVVVATVAGLTLVPALVAVTHRHIPARGERTWVRPWAGRRAAPGRPGLLGRLAGLAQRRPGLVALGSTALLVLLALPLGSLTLGSSEVRSLPVTAEERRAYEALTTGFSDLGVAPVTVLVDAPLDDPDVRPYLDELATLPGVTDADRVMDLPPDVTAVELTPTGDATGAEAQQLVHDVRAVPTDLTVAVAGPAAEVVDTQAHLRDRLPIALGVVALATFLLLLALTGSVVVPLKALAMNVLTIAATLGMLVAVFQWGWGAGLLGFEAWGALDVVTPLLVGMLVFGLSMDYEVFLLARIAEERRAVLGTTDPRTANDRAVLRGITATGPVVTLAAVAIGIVFLGFVLGDLVAMKEVGLGMAFAVLLDVTIVRGLLLPSTMTLLGRWNWWRPRWPRANRSGIGDHPA